MTKKTMHFTYDPIRLTRLFLDLHLEKTEMLETDIDRVATRDVFRTLTDEALEDAVKRYATAHGIDTITFHDAHAECQGILDAIRDTDTYRDACLTVQLQGRAGTGFGVYDQVMNVFYPCRHGEHFATMCAITTAHYPQFDGFMRRARLEGAVLELDGVHVDDVDRYIRDTFRLIGSNNPSYIPTFRKET